MLALMAWTFAKEQNLHLDIGRLLKMALCQRLYRASAKSTLSTNYDPLLQMARTEQQRRKILQKWVRYSLKEKEKFFSRSYRKEKLLISQLISKLPSSLKEDLMNTWQEFKENRSPEARFINHTLVLEVLLQALQYKKAGQDPQIKAWWEWAFELSDSELNLEFMRELKQYFLEEKKQGRILHPASATARTKR